MGHNGQVKPRIARLAALAVAVALAAGACGADGEDEQSGSSSAVDASTTLPEEAFSRVALNDAAIEFGKAMISRDGDRIHALMSTRCRDKFTPDQIAAVTNLVLTATERQQDVAPSDIRVQGALVGEIADGRGEAAIRLNEEVFKDQEFAILQMQPYVFEEGVWNYDGCDAFQAREDLGEALRGDRSDSDEENGG